MKVAVIGGTGVYDPSWLRETKNLAVDTPYGPTQVVHGLIPDLDEPVYFMNRHGAGHKVPPHQVNYRANIWALKSLGVERVVATAAVGSMNKAMAPGSIVLCDQFLDFTKYRLGTFYDGGEHGVVHTDMTEPYCPVTRGVLFDAGSRARYPVMNGGTYVTTEGPRFESPAEIRAYRLLGGDVVGMTGVPEVVLARELGLCYATVALVTNFAAGTSSAHLTHEEVLDVMALNGERLRTLLGQGLIQLSQARDACRCRETAGPIPG